MATAPDDMLGMSDEDFAKLNEPPAAPAADAGDASGADPAADKAGGGDDAGTGGSADGGAASAGVDSDAGDTVGDRPGEGGDGASDGDPGDGSAGKPGESDNDAGSAAQPGSGDAAGADKRPKDEPKPGDVVTPTGKPVDSPVGETKVFQVPTSFKANGKIVELKDDKEALALMQMGANYTRKMQELQPHRKVLMMLESNGIDEGKLSFLIDLEKKDPAAIQKLLKDSNIDPLEIDVAGDTTYQEGSHALSDDEVSFRTTMQDLRSSNEGQETLTAIATDWDDASKEVLWTSPEIMTTIHDQRQIGVYDVIKAEVDRRITVGAIPPNTPFLQAYKSVGDEMAQAALGTGGGDGKPAAAVVATRTAAPKSPVTNNDKASAASSTRGSPKAVTGEVKNPLSMSDDEFLKSMENRL